MTRLRTVILAEIICFFTFIFEIQADCTYTEEEEPVCGNNGCNIKYARTYLCVLTELPLDTELTWEDDESRKIALIQIANISEIPPASFRKMENVDSLDLCANHIKKISPGAFAGLRSLDKLSLCRNNLTDISAGIFNSLIWLDHLDLSDNRIESIDINFLTGTTRLTYLDLSHNCLSHFDSEMLGQNSNISILNLSDNLILQLNLNRSLYTIAELHVSRNNLTVIDVCLPGLRSLYASFNEIRNILAEDCYFNNIHTLDISYNLLDALGIKNISRLFDLISLNLAGNNLTFIPTDLFVNFDVLSDLNLSRNKLKKLDYGVFDHLKNLHSLDLSYNKLTSLNRYLHSLKSLVNLYINNNNLTNIDSKQILLDMPHINKINLAENDFSCDDLVVLIHVLGYSRVVKGFNTTVSNIHGIACNEREFQADNSEYKLKDAVIRYFENAISSKLSRSEGSEFDRSLMYNYFNKDFKNSNFYKYLESFKGVSSQNFNETNMVKYFNEDFNKSNFYKYLESLKSNDNSTTEFNRSLYNYFNNDFNNSNLIKYFKKLEESKNAFTDDFEKSSMYRYFNEGFEKSKFYQLLESLKSKSDSEKSPEFHNEYLRGFENNAGSGNPALLSVIIVLLIVLVIFKCTQFYMGFNKRKYNERENVQLMI